jgi:hypothetical protein
MFPANQDNDGLLLLLQYIDFIKPTHCCPGKTFHHLFLLEIEQEPIIFLIVYPKSKPPTHLFGQQCSTNLCGTVDPIVDVDP